MDANKTFFDIASLCAQTETIESCSVTVSAWQNKQKKIKDDRVYFGIAYSGPTRIKTSSISMNIPSRSFFRCQGPFLIGGGQGILIGTENSTSDFRFGKIPERGKIEYEPGGRMSTLCFPDIKGEASLNMLDMDEGFGDQVRHRHPSSRINLVIDGEVECELLTSPPKILHEGSVVILRPNQMHKFTTKSKRMRFVAFHPTSKWGPDRQGNTMLNETEY